MDEMYIKIKFIPAFVNAVLDPKVIIYHTIPGKKDPVELEKVACWNLKLSEINQLIINEQLFLKI
jgi:hypothetical protein